MTRHRSRIVPPWAGTAFCFALFCSVLCTGKAAAQVLRIVALGASNTAGMGRGATNMGVARGQAYPAQLERMLRAKGCNARVTNAGIAGDTTAGMLARLNSVVPAGTRIVILQPGGNDARRGASEAARAANVAAITARLRSRQIEVIVLDRFGAGIQQHRLADGQHFSAEGHAAVAARLLPQVIGACRSGQQ
jgi:acyl-CoA thioesterase-1